jgi:methyl-accepting chemotaxis protein
MHQDYQSVNSPYQEVNRQGAKMQSEMKIRTKLIIGFSILILTVISVAGTALYAISSLSSNVDSLLNNRIPQLHSASTMVNSSSSSIIALSDTYLDDSPDAITKMVAMAAGNRKAANEAMDRLKASLAADNEKLMYQSIIDKRTVYAAGRDKVIAGLKSGDKPAALAAIQELKPLRNVYLTVLKEVDSYVQEQAKLDGTRTEKSASSARTAIITLVSVALAITLLVAFWIIRSISGPLSEAITTANRIADRDLTVRVEGAGSTETGQLMSAMAGMVGNLKDIIAQTSGISSSIATASSDLHGTSEKLATGAEEVACQTHTVAAASEELSATSNDIALNCHAAAQSSQQAMSTAENGAKIVAHTVEVMNRIADRVNATALTVGSLGSRSDQIGAIVGTIEDIADQTNLLALNAAIEAARAGDQGRGFAVVADEVRALAERTTKATKEIGSMIKAIQAETQKAVVAMNEGVREVHQGTEEAAKSGDALQEILNQINNVSMQVNQIATAAEEQTATIGQIAGNINEISDVVQQTARGSQDSANSASLLATLSGDLAALVRQFKIA